MNRTTRIIAVMLLLLASASFSGAQPKPADAAVNRCGVEIAARYDYFSSVRLTGCISASTRNNLNVWNLYCASTSIGITISNMSSYEWSGTYSDGRKYTVVGCRYNKQLAYVFGQTSCWVEATIYTKWYGGSIGWGTGITAPRSNYC